MKKNHAVESIGEILLKKHIIDLTDFETLKNAFKNRDDITFEDFLLEEDIVSKDDLLLALSQYYGIPSVDVTGEFFDHRLLHLFPKDMLLRSLALPYYRDNDTLYFVVAEPQDPELQEILSQYISHEIAFMVGLPQDIRDAIREFYDRSNTYQPNGIENEQMERSAIDVHPMGEELKVEGHDNEPIPLVSEETNDDYESK